MKVKKQKRHRRAVRFYTACFGFREPFKVLCDGTFVYHLLANHITPADTALANILGATVKIFTTRCVLAELKSLGDSYSDSLNAAHNLITARCDHDKRKSAVACITEVIGEKNPEHFFVATQDAELRRKLQEIPGVPVIYALRNSLFLERPSGFQHQFAKIAEEERSHMNEWEYKLSKLKKKVAIEEAADASDANESNEDHMLDTRVVKANIKRDGTNVKDQVQFKRKKAKGPNPLSCKKKKTDGNKNASSEKESKIVDNTMRSRSRKRKRSRKSKNVPAATV
ncbi:rRNA-processing protein UTP23 homolog [Olea europaea var. sylvestris]|uniref:rRNA-processing protein UTP23 homolog n=1 Tax=Olea europaea var. sylvestris TaxID=158386 RepID=UPI000C1D2B9B|nr:rRNA-processing protein UTP23 homolog [Olea europaea var. sylvestris]XP_022864252.1 rRNA-processing protein UTP23 homolog [Olea europaea var. sylvestris]XP_022864253.1 rRNA-processing protein UTP23 homolog [Olea europaea var. sylvestris]XP_022864254.1 rRNA-processing protein UTP23 homolog [Olea europaea var. sylvestris]